VPTCRSHESIWIYRNYVMYFLNLMNTNTVVSDSDSMTQLRVGSRRWSHSATVCLTNDLI